MTKKTYKVYKTYWLLITTILYLLMTTTANAVVISISANPSTMNLQVNVTVNVTATDGDIVKIELRDQNESTIYTSDNKTIPIDTADNGNGTQDFVILGSNFTQFGVYTVEAIKNGTPSGKNTTIERRIAIVSIEATGAAPSNIVIVPIMINNVTNLGSGNLNVTYNASVVHVIDVTNGTGNALVVKEWNVDNSTGIVRIVAWNDSSPKSGNVIFANVTYQAVGNAGESSPLNLSVSDLTDYYTYAQIPYNVSNGTFTVSDITPPNVTNQSANPATILNDTGRARKLGTNVSRLNVTVTDDVQVKSVTINLSSIGGSAVQPMTNIGGNVWSVSTNATSGFNLTHNLTVNATDTWNNSNTSVSIQLTILIRGDVVRDGTINSGDALYIAKYLVGKEPAPNMLVSDVVPATGDDWISSGDALYIAKYLVGNEPEP